MIPLILSLQLTFAAGAQPAPVDVSVSSGKVTATSKLVWNQVDGNTATEAQALEIHIDVDESKLSGVCASTPVVDTSGAVWTVGDGDATTSRILRNGVQASGGVGPHVVLVNKIIYAQGTDTTWYRWTGNSWAAINAQDPAPSVLLSAAPSRWTCQAPVGTKLANILNLVGAHTITGRLYNPNASVSSPDANQRSFAGATQSTAPVTIFTNQVPQVSPGTLKWELATRFAVDVPGNIVAIRFFKIADDVGLHTGHIWDANGTLLSTVTFSNETASGWQEQALQSPLSIKAGSYSVSVNSNAGSHYAAVPGLLAAPIKNGHIASLAPGGAYIAYTLNGTYPTNIIPTGYFRDVKFDDMSMGSVVISTDPPINADTPLYATMYNFPSGTYAVTITVVGATGQTVSSSSTITVP